MGLKEGVRASYGEAFERRMRNWARAMAGSSGSYAAVTWGEPRGTDLTTPPPPVLTGEAEDTSAALATVLVRYRRAVELYWAWGDRDADLSALARRCGEGVDYRTFGRRVIDGHVLLQAELARRTEAWRQQRDRNENAIRVAAEAGRGLTGTILQV